MASSDDLTIVLPTQDDPEDETMELITSEGIPQTINSGDVTHTITTLVGTQNIFTGPTGTVGEATLDLRIDDAEEIFVETESFRNVERKLKDFGHVTICGASGEGKTTAALVLGSQYRQKGYKLAFVDRIEQFDLDRFLSSSPRIFLIIDDMFGTVGLSTDVSQLTTILNTLYQHLQHCKRESEKRKQQTKKEGKDESKTSGVSDPKEHPTKDIGVIFTSKTYNFHAGLAQLQYERFALFKSQTVMDLTTQKQHRYTEAEKKAIYEHHRNRHRESSDEVFEDLPDYEDLDTDSNIFGIPLTCKLFFEFSSFTRNARNFFKKPLLYLTLELRKLLKSNTDRSAILILMLLCEDKLDLAKLQADGKDQKLDIMVRTVLELRPKASRLGMHEAATTFRGTFFTRGDVVGFAHSSISDACACSLFDISPTFVLTHCSDNFIYERVQPQPVQEAIIDDHLHLIYVSEAYHDILTTRFAESIKNGQFSKSVTHPILQQEQVALQLLEKLQHDGSMDKCWVHKREKENCFLFWAVLGHNNNFVFEIENLTREEFTQTEISEAMLGCVFKNNLTALEWLFSRSESPDIGIDSLLLLAAATGSSEILVYLIENGANVLSTNADKKTIIHLACMAGHAKTLTVLKEHDIKLFNDELKDEVMNSTDNEGRTPLMVAALTGSNDCYQVLQSISNKKTKDNNRDDIVHLACKGGNTVIVQHLVSPSNINTRGQYGWTPVMMAAFKGHQSVFDLLVSKTADLTLVDNDGNSLLHLACYGGNTAIVQYLVSPSKVNTRGQYGRTPVMMAAFKGHQSVFDLLVSKDADLTLVDKDGDSLLHIACNGGNTAIVQHLLSPSNVNTRGQNGNTPVMMAAFNGYQSVFDLLVSKDADLTLVDNNGDSLLQPACYGGNTAIVQYLVSPSNVNTRGQYGRTPVMMAAVKGHQHVFDLLESKNADLTLVDNNGDSLFHNACYGGNTAIVQYLVSPSNINTRGQYGRTPVMMAAFKGHQSVFDLLVSKNADLTLVDKNGNSSLHLACNGGNTAIAQYLVSPSNVNTRGQNEWTPVMIAAFKGHQSVFDLLVSKDADLTLVDNNGDSLPHLACNGGNTTIVQYLVSPSNINTRGQNEWTPVMMAAFKGHQSVFDLLVSKNAVLTLVDNNGDSLLHLACYGGNNAIVQYLVSPSNVNTRGQNRWTPVMMAAMKGHQSVFHLLVSKHADLTLVDNNGDSLLQPACYGGNTAIVQHLVSPSNVNTRGQNGWTPVMMAAFKGHKSVFDLLVSKNADLTLVDKNGNGLLHLACYGGNTAIVQHLVSPSKVNTRGQYGRTPAMIAAVKGHQSVFDLLVSKNADLTLVDNNGDSSPHLACNGGNTAIVQYLVSPSHVNTRGHYGRTPVMMAAVKGHQSVFHLLVSKHADLTVVDNNGDSLLHLACYGGNTAIVQYLVYPSNVNTRGQDGWTPVMMAAFKGHQSVFDLLVSKHADLTLVDINGDSLLHLACYGGNTAIVQHLVCPSNINTRGQYGQTPVMIAAFKGHQSVFDLLVSNNADLTHWIAMIIPLVRSRLR
ncbi:serine/threonine-protein phosphatase 6 regulatory ankyrin repeat subunit B-like isoform X2 [Haliotis rufescens]|uniref:serine/threonine-protein phosphatase 6 regulatory ankyrin repeat subunit B-like isoform X2 n=1 Tax=Haliotis rufescens TaxID=6454 RepID=UPI00201EFE38|nr:serine/threonine-protein phosphatase 6 regulatory ankyrin repeat subunit B-like isoform X2 [Haliotis rufescens]